MPIDMLEILKASDNAEWAQSYVDSIFASWPEYVPAMVAKTQLKIVLGHRDPNVRHEALRELLATLSPHSINVPPIIRENLLERVDWYETSTFMMEPEKRNAEKNAQRAQEHGVLAVLGEGEWADRDGSFLECAPPVVLRTGHVVHPAYHTDALRGVSTTDLLQEADNEALSLTERQCAVYALGSREKSLVLPRLLDFVMEGRNISLVDAASYALSENGEATITAIAQRMPPSSSEKIHANHAAQIAWILMRIGVDSPEARRILKNLQEVSLRGWQYYVDEAIDYLQIPRDESGMVILEE